MKMAEILEVLRANGQTAVARELERKTVDDGLCSDPDRVRALHEDIITDFLENRSQPIAPEDIILSTDFAFLHAVALVMERFVPPPLPIIEGELLEVDVNLE